MNIMEEEILNEILNNQNDYIHISQSVIEANRVRAGKLLILENGFNIENFYLPEGHIDKNKTLFYDFAYGYEAKLSGTGLREQQFKSVFENENFIEIIEYIYPRIVAGENWNFEDGDELLDFCNGLFDYSIPNYKEALPIRLASYFYPNYFIPIFKLDHLRDICIDFGFDSVHGFTKEQALFEYNSFIFSRHEILEYDTYMKLYILSLNHYTIKLYRLLHDGGIFNEILTNKKKWEKNLLMEGLKILNKINAL